MLEVATKVTVLHRDLLLSAGLLATLRDAPDMQVVELAAADMFIADYEQGLALIAQARYAAEPGHGRVPQVLILTDRDSEPEIRYALEHGARGYLTVGCGPVELMEAVRMLSRGSRHLGAIAARRLADSVACEWLTTRETDVLRLLVEGHGNKAIARTLGIAIGTVKSHLKAIFQKLEANSRTQVAAVADRRGLLNSPCGDLSTKPGAPTVGRPQAGAVNRSFEIA